MSDEIKVYILKTGDTEFFVKEDDPKTPLLYITDRRYNKLYNRVDFDWDKRFCDQIGEEASAMYFADFDKCQRYIEDNPTPWESDKGIPFYMEKVD